MIVGEVFDVAVDIRKGSPTFGRWVGEILSEENKRQLWVPPGFAHGFLTLSQTADFIYKTTSVYNPTSERCIRWCDPDININWPLAQSIFVSEKDKKGNLFRDAQLF